MKKYMFLILLSAAVAACLLGCGRGDKVQAGEEAVADAVPDNVLAENNMVPTEDLHVN